MKFEKPGVRENSDRTFVVPSLRELKDRRFYTAKIWQPATEEHLHIGSRRLWKWALTVIHDYDGRILTKDGRVYHQPDVDDVFPDPDMRWMSLFLEVDPSGNRPKSFSRQYERLRWISLCCQIRRHEAARRHSNGR